MTSKSNKRFLQKLPPMSKPTLNVESLKKEEEKKEEKEAKKEFKKPELTKKKNRCAFDGCRKKLKITSLTCRCQKRFCKKHFLAEKHNCTYDYKKKALDNLIKKGHLDGCTTNTLTDKL